MPTPRDRPRRQPVTADEKALARSNQLREAYGINEAFVVDEWSQLCRADGLDPEEEMRARPKGLVLGRMSMMSGNPADGSHLSQILTSIRRLYHSGGAPLPDGSIIPGVYLEHASATTSSPAKRKRPFEARRPVAALALRNLKAHAVQLNIRFLVVAYVSRYSRSGRDTEFMLDELEQGDVRLLAYDDDFGGLDCDFEEFRQNVTDKVADAQRQAATQHRMQKLGILTLAERDILVVGFGGGGLCQTEHVLAREAGSRRHHRKLTLNDNARLVRRLAIEPLLRAARFQSELVDRGQELYSARAEALRLAPMASILRELWDAGARTKSGKPIRNTHLRKELTSPRLSGRYRLQGRVFSSSHIETLMTIDEQDLLTWYLAGDGVPSREREPGRPRALRIGTGYGFCVCGKALINSGSREKRFYMCSSIALQRFPGDEQEAGHHTSMRADPVEDLLVAVAIAAHQQAGGNESVLQIQREELVAEATARLQRAATAEDSASGRVTRLDEDYERGAFDDDESRAAFPNRRARIVAERDSARAELRAAQAQLDAAHNESQPEVDMIDLAADLSDHELREYCASIIDAWTVRERAPGSGGRVRTAHRIGFEFRPGFHLPAELILEIARRIDAGWNDRDVRTQRARAASPELKELLTQHYIAGLSYSKICDHVYAAGVGTPDDVRPWTVSAIVSPYLRETNREHLIRKPRYRQSGMSAQAYALAASMRPHCTYKEIAKALNARYEATGDAAYLSPRGKLWADSLYLCYRRYGLQHGAVASSD